MKLLQFREPAKPPCPDCRGRGCEWCGHTGIWGDATAAGCRAVADLLAAAAAHDPSPRGAEELQRRSDKLAAAALRMRG